jgi:hypothetical protein
MLSPEELKELTEQMRAGDAVMQLAMESPSFKKLARLYVATAAMQGLLAWGDTNESYAHETVARYAVSTADALLAELDKEPTS